MRSDKILYYLDFVELGDVIPFIKDCFEGLIPTENWIRGKFEELKEIRNRVAHNTYIDDDTFKAFEVYYGKLGVSCKSPWLTQTSDQPNILPTYT